MEQRETVVSPSLFRGIAPRRTLLRSRGASVALELAGRAVCDASERILDPGDPEAATPEKDASDTDWEAWHAELEAWGERLERHLESDGAVSAPRTWSAASSSPNSWSKQWAHAAVTCELCGKPGEQHCTRAALR